MDCVGKKPGSRRSAQPTQVNLASKADFPEVNSFSTIASSESSIPDHVRQYIAKTYSVDPNSTMFICSDKPQRVFVAHGGSFYYVDVPFIVSRELTGANEGIRHHPCLSFTDMAPLMCLSPQSAPLGWRTMTDVDRGLMRKQRRQTDIFKTALCREYRGTGRCSYGDGCRFAHGAEELRLPPQTHPKYKTQLCNKFALFGTCPYGARCQFIHRRPSEFNYAKEESRDVKSIRPSTIQSGVPSRFDAPIINLSGRSVQKMSKYLLSDDVNCVEWCGENDETEIRFNGSLPNAHFNTAVSSRWNDAPALGDANTISRKDGHVISNKAFDVEARCEASAISPSHGRGNTPGMQEFCNTLDNWLLDDSEGIFSQSCFPRLRSHLF
uniref:BACK domain-containing protein n=1 Tax=Parascaris univalens TaxID=6257 RepID=A0A914ZXF0_PARUN